MFGARAYLSPQNNNISQSYNVIGRYYFGGKDDYVNLSLGTGISPDDPSRVSQLNNTAKLVTYRAEVISRISIKRMNVLVLNFSYASQEYLPNTFGNQYQAGIGYIRKF